MSFVMLSVKRSWYHTAAKKMGVNLTHRCHITSQRTASAMRRPLSDEEEEGVRLRAR